MNTHQAAAQSNLISTAKTDIVTAFQSIETAEHQGASNSDIAPLIDKLNLALQLEVNASALEAQGDAAGATNDALQSINLSNSVSFQAQKLGDAAQTASQQRTSLAYFIAISTGVLAGIVTVESPRLIRKVRERRLRKVRIDYGGEKSAK